MSRELSSILVYGHTGTGKTTAVARAMFDALWVVTRKSNVSGYHSFLRQNPEIAEANGLKPIPDNHIIHVPTKQVVDGKIQDISTRNMLGQIIEQYCLRTAAGDINVDGIVFDEFSVFAKRVYEELGNEYKNGFESIRKFKKWVGDMCEVPDISNQPMCMICHAQDPKYDEGNPKPKYKGGPAMPIGTVVAEICALPDAVLQLEVRKKPGLGDEIERVFLTEAHPEWERKCRLWGVEPAIEPDLRKLLTQAGWYQ